VTAVGRTHGKKLVEEYLEKFKIPDDEHEVINLLLKDKKLPSKDFNLLR